MAPGTALVQKRHGGDGITIVTGGDAGTAEGDFASCLVWSTRPGNELPVLIVVTNNGWGISTPACSQHGEQHIIDRGKAFGIPGEVVDGNDPVASWHAIRRAMAYCRRERRPFMLEAMVSRLYGHSSSSGAAARQGRAGLHRAVRAEAARRAACSTRTTIEQIHEEAQAEVEAALEQALREPRPTAADVEKLHLRAQPGRCGLSGRLHGIAAGVTSESVSRLPSSRSCRLTRASRLGTGH